MLFNSLQYLVFLPTVFLLYYLTSYRYRWVVLLGASYVFYMAWRAEYIVLILLSTLIDYFCAMRMQDLAGRPGRKRYLYLSLLSNLGLLFTFKYYNFFAGDLMEFMGRLGLHYDPLIHNLLLPMGISFYTFQTMSYSIDVYNGKIQPEKHLGRFALFVVFFPQLVAGPIERAGHLLKQLRCKATIQRQNLRYGFMRILWGLFKKTVIADNVAELVNYAYSYPGNQTSLGMAMAAILFAVQIYCDFSGYSDIAIGSARLFGVKLMENFRMPYFSKTIPEFWSRWHISLSTWFRDYVYIPLGGNRVVKWRWYYNLLITFLLSGIWHGANWTFLVWGAIHGAALILTYMFITKDHLLKLKGWKAIPFQCLTVLIVVVAFIFFRAESIASAWSIVTSFFTAPTLTMVEHVRQNVWYLGQAQWYFLLLMTASLAVISLEVVMDKLNAYRRLTFGPRWLRWSVCYTLCFAILLFGNFGHNEFIYFQF